jgi:ubiquinone/menaquinone biosynthesis C-methylase UbiE
VLVEVLPAAPKRVLDLGGGDGRLTALVLATRAYVEQVVLVDRSPPMLRFRSHGR